MRKKGFSQGIETKLDKRKMCSQKRRALANDDNGEENIINENIGSNNNNNTNCNNNNNNCNNNNNSNNNNNNTNNDQHERLDRNKYSQSTKQQNKNHNIFCNFLHSSLVPLTLSCVHQDLGNFQCEDTLPKSLWTLTTQAAECTFLNHCHHALRGTIGFYAASSVILVLCNLTPTSAAGPNSKSLSLDTLPIFDQSSSDKEILDILLEKKRYDKRLLPPVNGTVLVNVNVLLLSLASPDESSLKYEVEFLLNQQWNDPRLQYGNKSHYEFLNALHHHEGIWTPDTYFIMHGDFKDPIIPMHFALRIYRNGTIAYAMRRHLILSCQGSLHIFPFDDPKCSFNMESISYEEFQIKYVWKNDEDTLRKSPSLTTLNAYLIKNQTTACEQNSWRGRYSCLQVELTFTRDRAYYFTTVFIPGIILVTSSFITFWLEWNAVPARVMIGVTTMLNFFTTSNGFRGTLPVVSNLTAMNVWDGVCMCFIYASLLEFVCVNYVGRKRPLHNVVYRPGESPIMKAGKSRTTGATNDIIACTLCSGSSSPCTHTANNGCNTETCFIQVRKKEPPHPIRVAKTIDVIARITFPTAYAIFLIFFFIHYKGFS